MPQLKFLKHELFAREYIKCKSVGATAYRRVYPHVKPLSSAKAAASRLMRMRTDVPRRINELRMEMIKKSDITIDRILTEYQQALDLAKAQERPADIVNAATAQAKLVGLLKDRVENTNLNYDSMENISDIIEALAQEAGEDVALALAKAMGVTREAPVKPPEPQDRALEVLESPTKAVN